MNPYETVTASSNPQDNQEPENPLSQEQAQLEKEQEEQRRLEACANSARCEALAQDENFQWFMQSCVSPLVDRERNAALDISLPIDKRDNAAHRHDIANFILGLLETNRRYWANQAKS